MAWPRQEERSGMPEHDSNQLDVHATSRATIAGLAIRYPVTVCMLLLSMIALGGISIPRIPLVMFPSMNAPELSVSVPYPNATPSQVLEEIVKPLEEALATIPGVRQMSSQASVDRGSVHLSFDWGEDLDLIRSEVRAKVDQIRPELPDDVEQVYVRKFSTDDIPILEGRIASGRDLRGSWEFIDTRIKKPLERVRGVAEVQVNGVEQREVEIALRLDDIKRLNVDVSKLFGSLDSANLTMSLGRISDGRRRLGVTTHGIVSSVEDLRNFPINERGLLLHHVADVELLDPIVNFGRHLNGEYAIGLEIRKASDANTVDTVNRVMAQIDRLNVDPALRGVEVLIWHNGGEEIMESLGGLLNAGLLGSILAIGVLYLFLRRLGATLLMGFCIPFSIVAAIGFMYLLGNSLNVLSMMGLMLSTGMLVDNAVVVLESIFRRIEKGEDRVTAARVGTREVVMAVVASTLTSVIIFVPLIFGKKTNISIFLGHTGSAIIVTLFCSLFISLTLIPLAMARFLRIDMGSDSTRPALEGQPETGGVEEMETAHRRESGMPGYYPRFLGWTLNHRGIVSLVSIAIIASAFQMFGRLPDTSAEAEEQNDVSIEYEFSESYHYVKIEYDFVNRVEQFLFENKDRFKLKDVYSSYENSSANTRLYFDTDRMKPGEMTDIREQIKEGLPVIPGADIRLTGEEGQSSEWMSVNIYGDDPGRLQQMAADLKPRVLEAEDFFEVYTGSRRGRQEVQVRLDRELARKFGVSPQSVSEILGIVLRGQKMRGFRTPEGEVDIWIRLQRADREDLDDLKSLVVGGGGDTGDVLLSQVAEIRVEKTPSSIQRENRQTYTRLVTRYGGGKYDQGKTLLGEVMDAYPFPSGYGWSFGFWTLQRDDQIKDFAFNIALALFMVYFVMAALFESISHPFAIMLSLLFAFVGVAWFLWLTGTPWNIMAWIGSLILIGVVVNNGIVLLDHINNLRREGVERRRAVIQGCMDRARPILMTAATTVVGLIPLAMGTTSLFELRYFPMARTVMGGLMASTILSLIVLPNVYTLFDDLGEALRRLWRRTGQGALRAPEVPIRRAPGTVSAE